MEERDKVADREGTNCRALANNALSGSVKLTVEVSQRRTLQVGPVGETSSSYGIREFHNNATVNWHAIHTE